jgi:antitoxin component HigA of HigAB toxin-antitoxin module
MMTRIRNEKEYKVVMKTIESLLTTASKKGGFHKLSKEQSAMLANLSRQAEDYEDNEMKLMPIKPKTLQEAIEFKRTEKKLTQAKLAKKLGIGAPKLSQILSGKREPDVIFLKAIHKELDIDAEFILTHV